MRAAVFLSLLATKWNVFWALELGFLSADGGGGGDSDGGDGDERGARFFACSSEGSGGMLGVRWVGAESAKSSLCTGEETETVFVEGGDGLGLGCTSATETETEAAAAAAAVAVQLGVMPYVDVGNTPVATFVFAGHGVTCAHFCSAASARSKTSLGTTSMWSAVGA